MPTFIDQLGHGVQLPAFPPQRIVSLVPSQTELLSHLGFAEQVIGITKFCVHPEAWRQTKTIVGGTKKFDFEKIDQLHPDLIIGNKEENYREGIEHLRKKYPVWMSDITTLKEALQMIEGIGHVVGRKKEAHILMEEIQREFTLLHKASKPKTVLYLIWRSPWMAAGSQTFIDSMLQAIGLNNAARYAPRYPELMPVDIRNLNPDLIFLSSEPYPFKQKHLEELAAINPHSKIMFVDGEMFSWYGSRLLKAPMYFRSLLAELER